MGQLVGKVVRSNSHVDYIGQVYRQGEIAQPPAADDYAFGRFVQIELNEMPSSRLVGVVYNTVLMNPEFGSLGPRLSPEPDLKVFSPDYLSEKLTLTGILALGTWMANQTPDHRVPGLAVQIDARISRLSNDDIRLFHRGGQNLRLGYLSFLLVQPNLLIPPLALNLLNQLGALFPEQAAQLRVLRSNLAWKSLIQPVS